MKTTTFLILLLAALTTTGQPAQPEICPPVLRGTSEAEGVNLSHFSEGDESRIRRDGGGKIQNPESSIGFLITINTTGQPVPYKATTAAQADSIILAATGVKLSTDSLTAGQLPYFFAEIYIEKKQAVKTKSGKTKLKKLRK